MPRHPRPDPAGAAAWLRRRADERVPAQQCPPNKLGITDPGLFRIAEADFAGVAQAAVISGRTPIPAAHGIPRLLAIHDALFRDVYEHAGQLRGYNFSKPEFEGGAERTSFADFRLLRPHLQTLFNGLRQESGFKGHGVIEFGARAAAFFDRLNRVHPFQEGNGRTQMTYVTMLANDAGHSLPFTAITRGRMYAVAHAAAHDDKEPLRELIAEQMDPARRASLEAAHTFLSTLVTEGKLDHLDDRQLATTVPGKSYQGAYVTAGGEDFIFAAPGGFYVGKIADLPTSTLKQGDRVAFTAQLLPAQAATRFFDEAERRGPRGRTAEAIDHAIRTQLDAQPAPVRAIIEQRAQARTDEARIRDTIHRQHALTLQR